MSDKMKRIVCIYACAAIAVLGLCTAVGRARLSDFRLAARYSSARAFEETVGAVDDLSLSLRKSLYATDGGMCCRLCSDVYADARAAETALSTLPFSTVELARISAFLGVAGDYAYTLCAEAAGNGFSGEQLETLRELSAAAEEFSGELDRLRSSVNDGTITMDTREVRLENVGEDVQQIKLSEQLNDYETAFAAPGTLKYDGRYTARDAEKAEPKSPEELAQMAADFLEVGVSALDLKYEYSGESCRRCYSCRGAEVCVCPKGVVSMERDRLVSDAALSVDEARTVADDFLAHHGYDDLEFTGGAQNGALAVFNYAQLMGDALCIDKTLSLTVALDDGSVHAFNAEKYEPELENLLWPEEEVYTSVQQPEGLTLEDVRPVVMESPGGRDLACWQMVYTDGDSGSVLIYVDAETGLQRDIVME